MGPLAGRLLVVVLYALCPALFIGLGALVVVALYGLPLVALLLSWRSRRSRAVNGSALKPRRT